MNYNSKGTNAHAENDVRAEILHSAKMREERDNARAECAWLAKRLIRLREALNNIARGAEDEGDRVYFGSTNDADWLKEIAHDVDAYAFDRILRESKWPDYIEASAKANARATTAEAEAERLRVENTDLSHREKVRSEAINAALKDANARAESAQARADLANKLFDQREEYLAGLDARNSELRADNERLTAALTRISCPTQTKNLLWWQIAARTALEGK